MITIGLTYTGDEVKHQNYVRWLMGENKHVTIVKLDVEENDTSDIASCDALVLSGGIDIDPDFYQGNRKYKNNNGKWYPRRDQFESTLYKLATSRKIPILGICRGMQLINVIEGGSLHQDLGHLNPAHRFELKDKIHHIAIKEDSLLHAITRNTNAEVNSAHHQAVNTVSTNLQANCYAEDGTIEGLEWKEKQEKPFLLCVQWHPERMADLSSPASKNIRDRYLLEIEQSIHQHKDL